MKTSFLATSAISQSLRHQMSRMQAELVQRQTELTTERLADPGKALGARAGFSFSMSKDVERLQNLIASNGLASSRLEASQEALGNLSSLAQELLSSLTTATSGVGKKETVHHGAMITLDSMLGVLNTNLNGEYLFGGINTDAKPLRDFTDPASPNRLHFEQQFQDYFGFAPNEADAANITAAQMDDFLTSVIEPSFMGSDWQTHWSQASDQPINSRISLNETAETSTTANGSGMRKLAMASALLVGMLEGPLQEGTRQVLYERTASMVGSAISDITATRSAVGAVEARLEKASDRLSSQVDVLNTMVADLEGVDPFEAATKVSDLMTQIEMAYALTSRIQKLSLVGYI